MVGLPLIMTLHKGPSRTEAGAKGTVLPIQDEVKYMQLDNLDIAISVSMNYVVGSDILPTVCSLPCLILTLYEMEDQGLVSVGSRQRYVEC